VEIFTLCDAATVDAGEKLNILGAFDTLYAPQAPITRPTYAIAIRCRFERIEQGTKKIHLTFIDSNGKLIFETLEHPIQIRLEPNSSTCTFQLIVMLPRIELPSFGEYSIDLAVDRRHEASIPLYVKQIPLVPPTLPPTPPGEPCPQITAKSLNPSRTNRRAKKPSSIARTRIATR
jgi:hypothetical protein